VEIETTEVSAHRPADTVARILAAAETLFSESSYDAVSMNDIAARAQVSKGNIFHHFSSKQSLYLEVVRAACADSVERLEELGAGSGAFAERLADYTASLLQSMFEHSTVQRLILRELLRAGEQQAKELAEKVFGDKFARLVAILHAGQERGELRTDVDPAVIATLIIGANVFFFESRDVLRHFPAVRFADAPAAYAREATDILLRGIVAPAAVMPARKT